MTAPIAPTIAALTAAQRRAVRLLGYPAWTDRDLLTGVRGPTLLVLRRLHLAQHTTAERGPPSEWCDSPATTQTHLWRLTRRGLRVKRALAA